jgi:hypothetical protein
MGHCTDHFFKVVYCGGSLIEYRIIENEKKTLAEGEETVGKKLFNASQIV